MPKLPGEGHQTRHWIPASSRERAPRRSVEDGVVTMKVTDNPERSRYELHDGDTLVGFSEYHLHDGQFAFLHTQVDPDFGGHGYGGVLVRASLDAGGSASTPSTSSSSPRPSAPSSTSDPDP
jgi:predicted GNAT family acetyltransferase